MQQSVIFHICSSALWAEAKHSEYRCPSLDSEGFIHCSTSDQVVEVADYLFRGQHGLILLVIDPDRVISPILKRESRSAREIKRRTEVVGIFPNEDAITRLIGAILLQQNDEWAVQRGRYRTLETIVPLGGDPAVSFPAIAN